MKINRRQFMDRTAQTAGAAGLSAALTPWPVAASEGETDPQPGRLFVGIATLGFPELSNKELAATLAAGGIRIVQLFLNQTDSKFWRYNSRTDVSSLNSDRCRKIADAYRDAGLEIHSLGVYTNLIHPDAAEREANLDYFEAMMKVGHYMNVRTFITEAGHHHDPEGPEPRIPLHFQDSVWPQSVDTVRKLARRAENYDAKILLEPFYRGFLASAKRTRNFVEEVDEPRIRVLLDPANLIEVNDLEEMFRQLHPWIDCLHAKDRKLHTAQGVGAGEGDVDYATFVRLAARHTPHAPLVMEYVGSKDYLNAHAHLRAAFKQAQIEERKG